MDVQRHKLTQSTDIDHTRLTYADYLQLEQILNAQKPLSRPPHHDELLFIIQHQTTELWLKLVLHELKAAMACIQSDQLNACLKILARVRLIQRQLYDQWGVLETLTPSEYAQFRHVLDSASGMQSMQYRAIEFLLGNKDRNRLDIFKYDRNAYRNLAKILEQPGLYDEFLRFMHRQGYAVPKECVERDWSLPYRPNEKLIGTLKQIYDYPQAHWDVYAMCEKLVDLEEQFHLWRFRHMKTVERIIGYKPGTGGTSGVAYLKKVLDQSFFPELFEVRTHIGVPDGE